MEIIADLVAKKTYTKLSLDFEKLTSNKMLSQSRPIIPNPKIGKIKTLEKKIEQQENFIHQLMKDVHEMKSLLQPKAVQVNTGPDDETRARKTSTEFYRKEN